MFARTLTGDPVKANCLSQLMMLLEGYHPRNFAVRLWDGTVWEAEPSDTAKFTVILKHPESLSRLFAPPCDLSLAEAYLHDDFDIDGDIEAANTLGNYLYSLTWIAKPLRRTVWRRLAQALLTRHDAGRKASALPGKLHSRERDRRAVISHYDLSNDFFPLWLDKHMVYSCAYFSSPSEDLDTAQERKLDYVCRKLRLRRGERFLDIGCGWEGLIMHAAGHYGTKALGLTLSKRQAELANERIERSGLGRSCRVEVCDYRELSSHSAFHKIVSVGMYEHVGMSALSDYFEQVWRLLAPGGVFLNHGISVRKEFKLNPFIDRYVFPDGEVVSIGSLLSAVEQSGFEVRDVESLREHYALTLRHWLNRLEAGHDKAAQIVGEQTYRVFRLYLSAFAARFRSGLFDVYQTLLLKSKDGESGFPLTRDDWYVRVFDGHDSSASS